MATTQRNPSERRLRVASALMLVALIVEALSLQWRHPTAFILFAVVSGGLLAVGGLLYLRLVVAASDAGHGDS